MTGNCRNCGAPHNNIKCSYCGTNYKTVPVKLFTKPTTMPLIKTPPGEKMTWNLKTIFILVSVCLVGVVVYAIWRNRQRLKQPHNF